LDLAKPKTGVLKNSSKKWSKASSTGEKNASLRWGKSLRIKDDLIKPPNFFLQPPNHMVGYASFKKSGKNYYAIIEYFVLDNYKIFGML
jgi:hypothetical protein